MSSGVVAPEPRPPAWLSSPPWPARLPECPPGGPDPARSTAETLPPSARLHTARTAGVPATQVPLGLGHRPSSRLCCWLPHSSRTPPPPLAETFL